MKQKNKVLLSIISLLLFCLGFEAGSFQMALLRMAREFQLDNTLMGFLVAAQYSAIIMMPLLFGRFSDYTGKKMTTMLFSVVFIAGCIMTVLAMNVIVLAIGIFTIGSGYSVCESAASAAIADAYGEGSTRPLNLAQCFFSLGAVVSPVVTAYLMVKWKADWRCGFIIVAAAFLLLLIPLFRIDFHQHTNLSASGNKGKMSFHMMFTFIFSLLCLTILAYVSLENGLGYFLDSYFTKELQQADWSAAALSLFWISTAISRLCMSLLSRNSKKWLLCSFASALILLLLLSVSRSSALSVICCIGLGLAFGPVWPTLMGLASQEFPRNSGMATSLMSTFCGIGGMLSPILMGKISDVINLRAAFILLAALALFGLILVLIYIKNKKREEDKNACILVGN